jgi:hypothetical protein
VNRREYAISITINDRLITKLIIDPHFEVKHADSINDDTIIALVKTLDGEEAEPEDKNPPFTYFTKDKIELDGRLYKLV